MHEEILNSDQNSLLPLLSNFSENFYLAGGTAIALQIGHRRSLDFDLFTSSKLNNEEILEQIRRDHTIQDTLYEHTNELTIIVNNVKLTFLKYPFKVDQVLNFKSIVKMPSLITLSAMKAYALGRRAKWKDYVDLYFMFKQHSFSEVVEEAKSIFSNEFNERLFREQVSYFKDIDHSEAIDYLPGFKTRDEEIEGFLVNIATQ